MVTHSFRITVGSIGAKNKDSVFLYLIVQVRVFGRPGVPRILIFSRFALLRISRRNESRPSSLAIFLATRWATMSRIAKGGLYFTTAKTLLALQ